VPLIAALSHSAAARDGIGRVNCGGLTAAAARVRGAIHPAAAAIEPARAKPRTRGGAGDYSLTESSHSNAHRTDRVRARPATARRWPVAAAAGPRNRAAGPLPPEPAPARERP